MTDARERLEAAIRDVLVNVSVGTSLVQQIADAVERALAPEPPAPLKVWPGVVTGELMDAHRMSAADRSAASWFALTPEDYSAIAAAGWRALVASLSNASESGTGPAGWVHISGAYYTSRAALAALAALADPYDGGGKGVGS